MQRHFKIGRNMIGTLWRKCFLIEQFSAPFTLRRGRTVTIMACIYTHKMKVGWRMYNFLQKYLLAHDPRRVACRVSFLPLRFSFLLVERGKTGLSHDIQVGRSSWRVLFLLFWMILILMMMTTPFFVLLGFAQSTVKTETQKEPILLHSSWQSSYVSPLLGPTVCGPHGKLLPYFWTGHLSLSQFVPHT